MKRIFVILILFLINDLPQGSAAYTTFSRKSCSRAALYNEKFSVGLCYIKKKLVIISALLLHILSHFRLRVLSNRFFFL